MESDLICQELHMHLAQVINLTLPTCDAFGANLAQNAIKLAKVRIDTVARGENELDALVVPLIFLTVDLQWYVVVIVCAPLRTPV